MKEFSGAEGLTYSKQMHLCKSQAWWYTSVTPELGDWRQMDPWNLLTSEDRSGSTRDPIAKEIKRRKGWRDGSVN